MFNQNNQQLIPMGMQQQQITNMPVQNIQTYIPAIQNMPQETDTFINVSNQQQQTGKGFWDGFKSVFSKIGEFCTNNFGLILTGLGIFGGYKFCSSSMQTYEENKKEGKLDNKGNLKDKDATIKENIMNFVGHGVHYVFGSNQAEEVEEDKTLSKPEKTQLEKVAKESQDALKKLLLKDYIKKGSISKILKSENPIIKICALEVIQENFNDIKGRHKFKRPETIVNALKALSDTSVDGNIRQRAINVATALKDNDYFNATQNDILKGISEIEIVEPKEEEKVDTKD